jgi:hypothetical protein
MRAFLSEFETNRFQLHFDMQPQNGMWPFLCVFEAQSTAPE